MKKIGLTLSVGILTMVSSCTDKEAYTLTGKIENFDLNDQQVYIQEMNEGGKGFNTLDSATVKNGTFVFNGKAVGDAQVRLISYHRSGDPRPRIIPFILEAGKINLVIDTTLAVVSGSPGNDNYQRFASASDAVKSKIKVIGNEYRNLAVKKELTPEKEEALNAQYESYSKELSGIVSSFIKANPNTAIGDFSFMNNIYVLDEDNQRELLGLVSQKLKNTPEFKKLESRLQALENTAIGKSFVDVKGKTPDGKDASLSEFAGKGKVVLVDFWASWCGPCIREMPTIVDAYSKYKSKGLEIVGISLDENKEDWEKAIKDHKITWPQMSDLKAWNSELAAVYGVNSIPHVVLLDKDGKIIEKNLRGQKLLEKIEELLK